MLSNEATEGQLELFEKCVEQTLLGVAKCGVHFERLEIFNGKLFHIMIKTITTLINVLIHF